ncbi:MAG: 3'(2'),5'-bisphosphate nucleotidase CysQ, partial [Rhodobacteraceae bacterium]|nr:3'(2'),5'-bisphosphate nucleotidase CysQ [Paracoccaceae bacterium]
MLLVEAARRASKIALPLAGGAAKSWEKRGNEGPVTEADLAINQMLLAFLRSERPDYGWLSEESEDDPSRLEKHSCFVI